jgi:twitching motility protein PilT
MPERIRERLRQYPEKLRLSDIHIRSGRALSVRADGDIITFDEDITTEEEVVAFLQAELSQQDWETLQKEHDLDFAVVIDGQRFRTNAFYGLAGPSLVFRLIITDIPNIDVLGLPQSVHEILKQKSGLVLVTGQTGSGKSTSLAAMIDKINSERGENIITIEDPIEFVHADKKSIISQREVGPHTNSFSSALKGALREDPDIILVGEMRDLVTISLALTAAETGHLVFGTLHTSGAASTISRVLDAFPAEQQGQIRIQFASAIQLVMTQRLHKLKAGKKGRVASFEVMVGVTAIRNLIRENKISQVANVLQTGAKYGMISMEKSIENLVQKGIIDKPKDEAFK